MTSPRLELQGAIVGRLMSDGALSALVGKRVFDRVPADTKMPYVSMGPTEGLSDDADCISADNITFQIDCWSDEPGFVEVTKVAEAVEQALDTDLDLSVNAMALFQHRQTRVFRDRGGIISHAVVTFEAIIERA